MEEEGLPLRRRVPGAERAGPGPWAPPKLSDSVLQRMQAAVNAAKAQSADQAVEQDPDIAPAPSVAREGPTSGMSASSVNSTPAVNGTSPAKGPSAVHGVQVKPELAAKPRRFSKRGDGPPGGKSEHDRGARLRNMGRARGTAAAKPARKARPSEESEPTELPMRTVPTPARQFELPALPEATASAPAIAPRNPSAAPRPTTLPQRSQSVPDTKPAVVSKPAQGLLPEASPRRAEPEPAALPKRSVPTTSKPRADPATRPERSAADGPSAQSSTTLPRSPAAPSHRTAKSQPPLVSSAGQAVVDAPPRQRLHSASSGQRKPFRTARLVAAVVFLAASAGVAALVLHAAPHTAKPSSLSPLQRQTERNRVAAAGWITQQVIPGTSVACDKQMCSALTASGFPARYLHVLGPTSPLPLEAGLVIETPAVRSLFGTSLNARAAPAVLTTIGAGQEQITIRAVVPDGVPAFEHELAVGQKVRQQNETELLHGQSRITISVAARKTIAAGNADWRLIVAIADLASSQPVHIVDFGSEATNPSANLPLRYADLAENKAAAHMSSSAYLAAIRAALSKLPTAYGPLRTSVVLLRSGIRVLRISVCAPSPLGL
jgi:hypothetical protein